MVSRRGTNDGGYIYSLTRHGEISSRLSRRGYNTVRLVWSGSRVIEYQIVGQRKEWGRVSSLLREKELSVLPTSSCPWVCVHHLIRSGVFWMMQRNSNKMADRLGLSFIFIPSLISFQKYWDGVLCACEMLLGDFPSWTVQVLRTWEWDLLISFGIRDNILLMSYMCLGSGMVEVGNTGVQA